MELVTQLVFWEDGFDCNVGNTGTMVSWCCLGFYHCYQDEIKGCKYCLQDNSLCSRCWLWVSISEGTLIHFIPRNSNDSFPLKSRLPSPNNCLVLVQHWGWTSWALWVSGTLWIYRLVSFRQEGISQFGGNSCTTWPCFLSLKYFILGYIHIYSQAVLTRYWDKSSQLCDSGQVTGFLVQLFSHPWKIKNTVALYIRNLVLGEGAGAQSLLSKP